MARGRFKKPKPLGSRRPVVSLPAPSADIARFTEYVAAQFNRTTLFLRDPNFSSVVAAIDAAYENVRGNAQGVAKGLARVFLASHQAMFSSAACIARGVPLDGVAASRRALEGARIALAIKLDRQNAERWISFEQRMARWAARNAGEKAPKLNLRYEVLDGDELGKQLGLLVGIFSDAAVHFTPEFFSRLDFQDRAGGKKTYSDYLQADDSQIAGHLASLAAAHLLILRALDRCCDGGFTALPEFRQCIRRITTAALEMRKSYPMTVPPEINHQLDSTMPTAGGPP